MNINSPGSITISGVVVLQSPRAVDPNKGPRNVVFDTNIYIVEGSETGTMCLLRYFAPNEMADEIMEMTKKKNPKSFHRSQCMSHYLSHYSQKKNLRVLNTDSFAYDSEQYC